MFELYIYLLINWVKFPGSVCCSCKHESGVVIGWFTSFLMVSGALCWLLCSKYAGKKSRIGKTLNTINNYIFKFLDNSLGCICSYIQINFLCKNSVFIIRVFLSLIYIIYCMSMIDLKQLVTQQKIKYQIKCQFVFFQAKMTNIISLLYHYKMSVVLLVG